MVTLFSRRGTPFILAAIVAISCVPSQPPAPGGQTIPSERLAEKQTLTWGTAVDMPTLHPYVTAAGTQRRYDIYDLLTALDASGKPGPMIATDWKLLDDKTWQLKIRTDVKFHDGSPLTVQDVKFSYDSAKDPAKKYSITTRAKTIDAVEIIDTTTINIKTKDPDPLFLRRAALIPILPKAYLERVGDDQFGLKPIGSGPFKVREFIPNSHLHLDAVVDHPFRKATLTQVTVRFLSDPSTRLAGLKTGEIDFTEQWSVEQLKQAQELGLKVISIDAGQSRGYWVDTVVRDKPTAEVTRDKRVRQALNYAIDKDAIVKSIYSGQTKAEQCQPIQPETFGYHPGLKAYPYDPEKAKRLLAEAGATGATLKIEALRASQPEYEQINLFVQSQLKAVGLNVELVSLGDYSIFRDKFYGDQPRAALFPPGLNNQPLMDADGALTWFASDQPLGARHYDNAEFDKWYKASMTEMNEQRRLEYVHKALEVFCEDPPYLFTVQDTRIWAYNSKLAGVEKRVDREPRLDQIRRLE